MTFLFNVLHLAEEVETLEENGEASSHIWQTQEKIQEKPIRFWRIVLLTHCSQVYTLQWTGDVLREIVYLRFFQFWLISPNRNYQSRSIECNLNWCWHHTIQLKKKTFPIFENLLKTGTVENVLNCLTLYRWLACVFIALQVVTSSSGSRPRHFLPLPDPGLVPKSPWKNSCTASVEEFYYSFFLNKGLENKLTRGPLLDLARSI